MCACGGAILCTYRITHSSTNIVVSICTLNYTYEKNMYSMSTATVGGLQACVGRNVSTGFEAFHVHKSGCECTRLHAYSNSVGGIASLCGKQCLSWFRCLPRA